MKSKRARINKRGFNNPTIALIIEMRIYHRYTFKAIGNAFSCSEKTVALYVNKYYYGKGMSADINIKQSKINDQDLIAA